MSLLDTACTFTTTTKMSTASDGGAGKEAPHYDQPALDPDRATGYGRLVYCQDKESAWPSLQAGSGQQEARPSWMNIHDIVNTKSHDGDPMLLRGCLLDQNQNVIYAGHVPPDVEGRVTAGVAAPVLPLGAEQLGKSRKRPRPEASASGVKVEAIAPEPSPDPDGEKNSSDLFSSIARAILHAKDGQILLADIYAFMVKNYSMCRNDAYKNWRVRVRHVLSVNSCFVKGKRAKSGRGFYWTIHPACLDAFRAGDIGKRRASLLVKRWLKERTDVDGRRPGAGRPPADGATRDPDGFVIPDRVARHQRIYVPMTTIVLSEYDYYELLMNLSGVRKQQ